MGAISFSLDESLVQFLVRELPLKLFVETGTFEGDTLARTARYIPNCLSVEKSPELFSRLRTRFQDQPGIKVHLGDSPAFLREHQDEFSRQAALFWLDAHWCQREHTSGLTNQCPLLEELAALKPLYSDSIVLIDDARLYLCAPARPQQCNDWPDFHSVVSALLSISSSHRLMVLNDVIIFYPERIAASMREFAHHHGVDWLKINEQLQIFQSQAEERRLRRERRWQRYPFINFFRRLWQQSTKPQPDHASH